MASSTAEKIFLLRDPTSARCNSSAKDWPEATATFEWSAINNITIFAK